MSVPTYPDDLPRPRRDGYSQTLPDGRLATKRDAGPPRVRRRFSAAPGVLQMVIDLTLDQRARFWRFWEEDAGGGSLPFWMPDWVLEGAGLMTGSGEGLTDEAGRSLVIDADLLCMFGTEQAPTETVSGVTFRLSFPLTILP